MENEQIKQIILRELPGMLRRDPEVREFILELSREHFADKAETESRFDRLLEEMRRERERSDRRWEEHLREFRAFQEEQARKWEEHLREFRAFQEEQARKWEEHLWEFRAFQEEQARKWEEHRAFQEEQARKWEENQRRWEENSAQIRGLIEALKAQARKHDQSIGALGARWGIQTEEAFRNALAGILGDLFGLEVTHVTEYDRSGEVFGRPEQVELDLIIKDGLLIIGEIKSSVSQGDVFLFERKARFYEKAHKVKADRWVMISPMVDRKARHMAEELGIEVYSYAEDAGRAVSWGGVVLSRRVMASPQGAGLLRGDSAGDGTAVN
ncbi:MAG: DUF3782 domain-containing protein [Ardenticatenia bacterium]|nr:DUF3782 domain-containing protein [Ardenticatenia bacterium]